MIGVDLNQVVKESERANQIASALLAEHPHLGVTAYVMAGDKVSAERVTRMVKERELTPREAVNYVGSYARFEWAVANLQKRTLARLLPELWRGSDPDDTNPEYLAIWRDAWIRNGQKTVCDGEPLPIGKLRIYRGQMNGAVVGFSWTLNRSIAAKFAYSGGLRGRIPNGIILNASIQSEHVYGYLTERGESEIIIDPSCIRRINGR